MVNFHARFQRQKPARLVCQKEGLPGRKGKIQSEARKSAGAVEGHARKVAATRKKPFFFFVGVFAFFLAGFFNFPAQFSSSSIATRPETQIQAWQSC